MKGFVQNSEGIPAMALKFREEIWAKCHVWSNQTPSMEAK